MATTPTTPLARAHARIRVKSSAYCAATRLPFAHSRQDTLLQNDFCMAIAVTAWRAVKLVLFGSHQAYTGKVLLPLIELKGFLTPILHFRTWIHEED